jgi:hypothetical protein
MAQKIWIVSSIYKIIENSFKALFCYYSKTLKLKVIKGNDQEVEFHEIEIQLFHEVEIMIMRSKL